MATSPRLSTWRRISLVQFVCVLMIFTAGNSAALETEPQSTLGTSHHGCQNLKVNSGCHRYPRRGCITSRSSKHNIHGEATSGESYSQVSSSTFKNADYGDNVVLLVSAVDGTADYGASIQDTVDQEPENNTRSTIVYITSGVYVKMIISSTTKQYITLQGEGRNRTVFTWNDTAAAAVTLKSTSVVVESDHFGARDISLKNSAGPRAADNTDMLAAAFRMSGGTMASLYRCNFFCYQDTLYNHAGRHHYFRCLIEGSEEFTLGVARSSQIKRCGLHLIAHDEVATVAAQGKKYPGSIMGLSGLLFLSCIVTCTGRPHLGREWGQFNCCLLLLPSGCKHYPRRLV